MRTKVSSLPGLLMVVTTLGVFTSSACSSDEKLPLEEASTDDERTNDDSRSGDTSGNNDTNGNNDSDATSDSDSPVTSDPTDEGPFGTVIGVGCTRDSDCESPTRCVREDASFRGSIPGSGICTLPCETHDECGAIDGLAYCAPLGAPTDEALAAAGDDELPEGSALFCVSACPFGAQTSKCGDLSTSTCIPIDEEVLVSDTGEEFLFGLCSPLCSSDTDCERNEYCDVGWGYCLPERARGKASGEQCDLEANECAGGFCLAIDDALPYGVCADPCNLHLDTIACGGEPGEDARLGCYPHLFLDPPSAQNDLGQCLPLCEVDADCPKALACFIDEEGIFLEQYGRSGMCFPTDESVADAIEELETPAAPSTSAPNETSVPPSETSDTSAADAGL